MKAILILFLVLLTAPAMAQQRKDLLGVPGGIVHPLTQGTSAASTESDPLAQLAAKFNADLNSDLANALALASQKDAAGNVADQTAVPCYSALLNLNALINGLAIAVTPTNITGPQVVSRLEKLRILKNALSNQNFKDACAPLVQDIQQTGTQFLGQVLSIVGGAAKLGIALP
jgi:hypothetical protein